MNYRYHLLKYSGIRTRFTCPSCGRKHCFAPYVDADDRPGLNYWVVYCGGAILTNPPALSGVEAPAEATIAISADAFTFTLPSVPSDVTNLKLVIQASEPQSNGITSGYSKAAAFADPYAVATTAIELKAAYDAKCGTPSAGAPKVFMKYFYVNTATGEKSGEVFAAIKFG